MMFKRFKNKRTSENAKQQGSKRISSRAVGMLLLLVLVTMVVFSVYRFLLDFYYFEIVLIVYMVIATAFILTYFIYNRGMSRRGITAEMLPESWSEEQKNEFIESGERRFQKSKWMLIPIFAFLFTFAYDVIELLVVPLLRDLFFS